VEGIVEPVGRAQRASLRQAVLEHVTSEHRRVFPPLLHVGVPAGRQAVFAADPDADRDLLDHASRTDVVAALLRRAAGWGDPPLVWLTRPGELLMQDVDASWLTAARAAAAEAELPLTLVVVTRRGWWDPRSGVTRTWRRLRAR
jgi:hypothetical protein